MLLLSICSVESSLRSKVINHNDHGSPSIGLCQIKLSTAKFMGYKGTREGLLDPNANALYAAKYFKYLRKRYRNNKLHAVAAYNRGSIKYVNHRLSNIKYVLKVLNVFAKEMSSARTL